MSGGRDNHQVLVMGGGLAGLTAAIQIRQQHGVSVALLERAPHPYPEAAHKVGESTVEIGAHYLCHHIGLKDHLDEQHLRKFGLRCFFGEGGGDLAQCDEVGTSRVLNVPTYQIDRGRLENHLWQRAAELGIRLKDQCQVTELTMANGNGGQHQVHYREGGETHQIDARWLVDASGRRGLIKRRLELAEDNRHLGCSVWFRVRGRVRVDDWSEQASWHSRVLGTPRWLSTNHLMGPGYWVWLIPLADDITSVGIVFDPECHPFEPLRSYEGTLAWFEDHHPRLAADLADRELMDFRFLKDYSYGCKQVFSEQRWALTGEAGVFLDPFYSPGSDFIGIGNTMIADLIGRDLRGECIKLPSRVFQQLYQSFYESTLLLYRDLYPGFGDSRLMAVKTIWDYAYYWGVLSLLFFSDAIVRPEFMADLSQPLIDAQKHNRRLQKTFRERAAKKLTLEPTQYFVDQSKLPLLVRFNEDLIKDWKGDDLAQRLKVNIDDLGFLSERLAELLGGDGTAGCERERAMIGDLRERLGGERLDS